MTTTYELYTNENGTPKAVEGKAPAIIERVEALETDVTGFQSALDSKANDAELQVDLTAIRESISNVSSKVDGIGDTLSLAKKQTILDACDQAMNGANPVHAGDPALDDVKSALATIQAQLSQLENRRYVKETGKSSDGTSWYRVWSDGWIEQGGKINVPTGSGASKFASLTFNKPFSNTNYILSLTVNNGASGTTPNEYRDAIVTFQNPTAETVIVWMYDSNNSGSLNVDWYACGY